MPIAVNHKKRREEILRKGLRLIADRGYPTVTYQQIADVCGLSRTSLYKYFKNKQEIFDAALLNLVANIGNDFQKAIRENNTTSAAEKIRMLCAKVIDTMFLDPPLLRAIIEYLIALRRKGIPVARRVQRHTITLHRSLALLIREGVANGEFQSVDCEIAAETFYAFLVTNTIQLTLTEDPDRKQVEQMVELVLNKLKR